MRSSGSWTWCVGGGSNFVGVLWQVDTCCFEPVQVEDLEAVVPESHKGLLDDLDKVIKSSGNTKDGARIIAAHSFRGA